jgi:Sec-independent protein secretion pathway component TatC
MKLIGGMVAGLGMGILIVAMLIAPRANYLQNLAHFVPAVLLFCGGLWLSRRGPK